MRFNEGRAEDGSILHGRSNSLIQNRRATAWSGKWLIMGLLVLSAFPLLSGAFRLAELAGISEIMPARERFHAAPFPVVLHIVSATLYAILGAFQFARDFRRRNPGWHRIVGRLVVLCGLLVGLSGVWMTLFYPYANGTSTLLYLLRLLFGTMMVLSIVLAFVAIRRGKVQQHRVWMVRAYAVGLGASTQMLILMVAELIAGPPSEFGHALLMGSGWGMNLAVAEWIIRKRQF